MGLGAGSPTPDIHGCLSSVHCRMEVHPLAAIVAIMASDPIEPTGLEKAVGQWINAEWEFRCGSMAYRADPAEWLLKAERKLRRALTGKGDLDDAHTELSNAKASSPSNKDG